MRSIIENLWLSRLGSENADRGRKTSWSHNVHWVLFAWIPFVIGQVNSRSRICLWYRPPNICSASKHLHILELLASLDHYPCKQKSKNQWSYNYNFKMSMLEVMRIISCTDQEASPHHTTPDLRKVAQVASKGYKHNSSHKGLTKHTRFFTVSTIVLRMFEVSSRSWTICNQMNFTSTRRIINIIMHGCSKPMSSYKPLLTIKAEKPLVHWGSRV